MTQSLIENIHHACDKLLTELRYIVIQKPIRTKRKRFHSRRITTTTKSTVTRCYKTSLAYLVVSFNACLERQILTIPVFIETGELQQKVKRRHWFKWLIYDGKNGHFTQELYQPRIRIDFHVHENMQN